MPLLRKAFLGVLNKYLEFFPFFPFNTVIEQDQRRHIFSFLNSVYPMEHSKNKSAADNLLSETINEKKKKVELTVLSCHLD